MTEHYFIDAYNVIHKSSLLRPVASVDLERAREMLMDKVLCFCLSGKSEVTIVFDGRDQEQSQYLAPLHGRVNGLRVIYSPLHTTADSVIERLIYQENNRMRCIVVSNDQGLRSQCRGMGALTMEADSFLASVRQIHQGAREQLAKHRQDKAALLEDRLDPGSLHALESLRDALARKDTGKNVLGKKKNK